VLCYTVLNPLSCTSGTIGPPPQGTLSCLLHYYCARKWLRWHQRDVVQWTCSRGTLCACWLVQCPYGMHTYMYSWIIKNGSSHPSAGHLSTCTVRQTLNLCICEKFFTLVCEWQTANAIICNLFGFFRMRKGNPPRAFIQKKIIFGGPGGGGLLNFVIIFYHLLLWRINLVWKFSCGGISICPGDPLLSSLSLPPHPPKWNSRHYACINTDYNIAQ
jgi:hypothetical protein